jgi:hypothetical protein
MKDSTKIFPSRQLRGFVPSWLISLMADNSTLGSYEKEAKDTFIPGACGKIPAMASIVGNRGEIKVFWFFSSEKNTFLSIAGSA